MSGSLLLPACDITMPSAVKKDSSSGEPQVSDSQSAQSSDDTSGITSNPDDNPSIYEVSASEWDNIFKKDGLFSNEMNVTLAQQVKVNGVATQNNLIENNKGSFHMLFEDSTQKTEYFIKRLEDSTLDIYLAGDDGLWTKTNMPGSYISQMSGIFATVVPPMTFNMFTYDASSHAYKMEAGRIIVGQDQMDVSNVEIKFENKQLLSINYDATANGETGSISVIASKYGTTSFSFPTVNSQGQGETPDTNLFSNSVFRYQELKDCQVYSDTVTAGLIQGYMCTSEIYLFEDGEFEMFYKDARGLRYVILGSYTIPQNDKAVLATRSLYSDKDQAYSFNVPALYTNFVLSYVKDSNTYEMEIYFLNDEGTALAKTKIAFVKVSDKPTHLDLPQEPVNDKWSVSKDVWDNIFVNAGYINRSTNLTITHSNGTNENILAFDNAKIYSKITYDPAYGLSANEIYLKVLDDSLSKVDYYEYDKTNQIWTVRQNVNYDLLRMVADDLGIKAYSFNSATYNNVGHYYAIRKIVEYPYGEEAGYSVEYTDIKIYFENNQLQKITFKDYTNQTHTYLYSQYGSTVVTLPDVGTAPILEDLFATKAFKYNSYTNSNSAFDPAPHVAMLANDEIRFFHDTTDYTFEWLMENRNFDNTTGNSIVLCGLYTVKRTSSASYGYQYYLTLKVRNVYINGMALEESGSAANLFDTMTIYYFEAENNLCYREDDVPFQKADGTTDYTDIKLFFKGVSGTASHFDLPRLDDNWSQYDVIMAMSQIGVMNDNLPIMHYVKTFSVSSVDTTNQSFDITCVMPSAFFVKYVFEPYKAALRDQYRYSVEYNSNREIVTAISPNGEFKITFEVKNNVEVIFHVQNYVASIPEAKYPTSAVAEYIRTNNITDTIPEFKVQGATQYAAYGERDYLSIFIYLDANLIDNAVTSLAKLLTDLDYVVFNVGETVVYSSKNNQLSIVISPDKDHGLVGVMFIAPLSGNVLTSYPKSAQDAYLEGVTDTLPDFDHIDGEKYMSYGQDESAVYYGVAVYLKESSTADVVGLVSNFEKTLVDDYEFEKLLVTIDAASISQEEYYVSKNRQVAISFEYSERDKAYAVKFINLTLYSDVTFLHTDSPVYITLVDFKYEFEVGDDFSFGENATAYATLIDGREVQIDINDLSFEPITFTETGSYEIAVSYTVDGVTVTETLNVWVYDKEPEFDEYTVTIENIADVNMEDKEIMVTAYGGSYGDKGSMGFDAYYDEETNTIIVDYVDTEASVMYVYIVGYDVTYRAVINLEEGQTQYTVSFLPYEG